MQGELTSLTEVPACGDTVVKDLGKDTFSAILKSTTRTESSFENDVICLKVRTSGG